MLHSGAGDLHDRKLVQLLRQPHEMDRRSMLRPRRLTMCIRFLLQLLRHGQALDRNRMLHRLNLTIVRIPAQRP
jgi:hypothetical protein